MKNIITETYFRKEYKYNGVVDNDEERITTENIEFYIGRATSRVNTILSRVVDKGITAGIYEIPDSDNLKLVEDKFPADEIAEETKKVEAIKEAVAILTKFGIDTGWDFITGSFSASIGTESFSDSTDFETSVTRVETNVKELLANYDFGNLLIVADSFRIAVDDEAQSDENKPAYVSGEDRTLTEAQLVTRLVDPIWTEARNGIRIYPKDASQPSKGIIIDIDGATIDIEAPTDELNDVLVNRFGREAIPTDTVELATYVRILSELFNDLEGYKLKLEDADGNEVSVSLKDALEQLQEAMKLIGTYAADDPNGELDTNESVIRNVVIIRENQKAVILRVDNNDNKITVLGNTKADKTTTDALQADINNIVQTLISQEVWVGDFDLPLIANDNIIPWSADITNALNNVEAGRTITLKLQNAIGDPISVFLTESVNDNSFTSESFNGDPEVQVKVTTAQFELNGLRANERGDYKVIEIRSIPSTTTIDLSNYVVKDLSNANVGAANVGKHFQVKADGTLTLVDYISQIANGMEQRFYPTGKQELWQGTTKISEDEVIFKSQYEEKEITTTEIITLINQQNETKLPTGVSYDDIISISADIGSIIDAGLNKLQVSLSGTKHSSYWRVVWYADHNYFFRLSPNGDYTLSGSITSVCIVYKKTTKVTVLVKK